MKLFWFFTGSFMKIAGSLKTSEITGTDGSLNFQITAQHRCSRGGPGMRPGIRVSYGFGIRIRTWKFRVWGALVLLLLPWGFFLVARRLLLLSFSSSPPARRTDCLGSRKPGPQQQQVDIMPFRRYVEIGRVALVNYGPQYGKLVVIVDVIDQNRALIDSPDMVRTSINFKRLSLTDITISISRNPKKKDLAKAVEEGEVYSKWESSAWGRKLAVRTRRASLNDFDRFKVMVARIKKSSIVRRELGKLRKEKA